MNEQVQEAGQKQRLEEEQDERQRQIEQAKTALFGYLAEHHPQVAHIDVHYDGEGDEGYIGAVYYYNTLDADAKTSEVKDDELDKLICDVFDCVTPAGFEDNDGGNGEIHIYPESRTIRVEHYQNIVEQEFDSYEV